MTDARTTRCPQCHTVFRVTEAQLAAHAGQVRCGRCRQVFDGRQSLLSAEELAGTTPGPHATALTTGTAAATPTSAQELAGTAAPADALSVATMGAPVTEAVEVAKAAESKASGKEAAEPGEPAEAEGAADAELAANVAETAGAEEAAEADRAAEADQPARADRAAEADRAAGVDQAAEIEEKAGANEAAEAVELRSPAPDLAAAPAAGAEAAAHRFSWERRDEGERRWVWAVLVPLLALLLAAQAAYQLRHLLAARVPVLRPLLIAGCQWIGCRIEPPRSRDRLSIEASELQADAAHRGLLVLTATLRNRADMAIAYPHLELTLTDLQQQAVARRAFAPGEYAGGTAQLEAGIPANGEVTLKLFIDASATQQQGYRLYLFYP